jgi:4-alpha-glucanotransferase
LAAATSHDLPTTAGLWTGTDLDYQKSKGFPVAEEFTQSLIGRLIKHTGVERGAPVGEVVARTYEEIARSASVIATSTLEDALEVEERHNYPGTSGPWNWSTALPATLEEAFADPRVQGLATSMNAERSQKVAR